VSHKYQKFAAQEASSSSSSSAAGAGLMASHSSSVSLQSSGSATSLSAVEHLDKSFVPRQKLLLMTIDGKTVSAPIVNRQILLLQLRILTFFSQLQHLSSSRSVAVVVICLSVSLSFHSCVTDVLWLNGAR